MGLLKQMREARFWKGWKDRFEDSNHRFVTPDNPLIVEVSAEAHNGTSSDEEAALQAWEYIYDNVEYVLSKEWKEPAQTLRDGTGDCEDVTFLTASMLPNMGVESFKVVIGEMVFPSGAKELHTWVEVGDLAVDPTGSPTEDPSVQYRPVQIYRIKTE